jgi:hypothetical protein
MSCSLFAKDFEKASDVYLSKENPGWGNGDPF